MNPNVRILSGFGRYLLPYKMNYLLIMMAMLMQSGIGLVQPVYYKVLVDDVLNSEDPRSKLTLFITILVVLGGLRIISIALGMMQGILATKISVRAINALESDIFRKLHHLPMQYHDRHAPGEVFPRLYSDPPALINFFISSLPNLLISGISAVVVFIIILNQLWWAAFIALLPVIPIYFISSLNVKYFRDLSDRMFEKQQMLYTRVLDVLDGIRIVRIFGRSRHEIERFNALQGDLYRIQMESAARSSWMSPLIGVVGKLGGAVIFLFGAARLLHLMDIGTTAFTLGSLLMILSYVWQLANPISSVAHFSSEFGNIRAASARVRKLLSEPELLAEPAGDLVPDAPAISFSNVKFGYDPEKLIIKGVSFEINEGEVVGIVGPSGSGKTTLLNLVCGFYQPNEGSVRLFGSDPATAIAKSCDPPAVSLAMQDGALLQGTILENLRYANPSAGDSQIWDALRKVEADQFVRALPKGIDTLVGEGAKILSSGQLQRIAIARAILADAKILILDEATSWVDLWTEQRIFRQILRANPKQAVLCISHRLHLMQLMDRVMMLKDGLLISCDTHDNLLKFNDL
jgi:ATP-binding cassette, subfamily B, bacterial